MLLRTVAKGPKTFLRQLILMSDKIKKITEIQAYTMYNKFIENLNFTSWNVIYPEPPLLY